jgi:hypothetical protein
LLFGAEEMADAFVTELRNRIQTMRKRYDEARANVQKAKAQETQVFGEISALERILESVLKERGEFESIPVPLSPTPTLVPVNAQTENKTDLIRKIIRQSPAGITPGEIRKNLAERGIVFPVQYVYSVLNRSKKARKITERGGKYFAVEDIRAVAS